MYGALKQAYEWVARVWDGYTRANGPQFAAAIAYHALFAMAPLTLVLVAFAGRAYGDATAAGSVTDILETLLGSAGASVAEDLLRAASSSGSNATAGVLGGAIATYGSARAFVQLQAGLNRVWGIAMPPGTPWWRIVLARLIPFGMVFVGALALLGAMLARGLVATAVSVEILPAWLLETHTLSAALIILATFLLMAFVLRALPDVRIAWRDVWFGAVLTTTSLAVVTYLLQTYIARTGIGSVFGAAGSLVAIVFWVYICAQLVLVGAEVTEQVAEGRGMPIRPAPYAARFTRQIEDGKDPS